MSSRTIFCGICSTNKTVQDFNIDIIGIAGLLNFVIGKNGNRLQADFSGHYGVVVFGCNEINSVIIGIDGDSYFVNFKSY